jgi:hypothetical protein
LPDNIKLKALNTSGFFETFFNNAKYNGIVIMDTKGIIININAAFHLRFGYQSKHQALNLLPSTFLYKQLIQMFEM